MNLINIAYIYKPHIHNNRVYLTPAVDRQQGTIWNYVVVCCDDKYNGVYRYSGDIKDTFTVWNNKGKDIYNVPIEQAKKIRNLDQIDGRLPLGKEMLSMIDFLRSNYNG